MSLERVLAFISKDELAGITTAAIRVHKRYLKEYECKKASTAVA